MIALRSSDAFAKMLLAGRSFNASAKRVGEMGRVVEDILMLIVSLTHSYVFVGKDL